MDRLGKLLAGAIERAQKTPVAPPVVTGAELRVLADEIGLPHWPWCSFGQLRFEQSSARAREASQACERWTRSDRSMVLSGPTGCGKTTCLVALGRRLVKQLRDPKLSDADRRWLRQMKFVRAIDLLHSVREHRLGSGEANLIDRSVTASLLLLDDMGNEPIDRDRVLFDVLDRRYMRSRPTIITTYLSQSEMGERYGDALVRRLIDHGSFVRCTDSL